MKYSLPMSLVEGFETRFDTAMSRGFAPFPLPLERANRSNSSPFIIGYDKFAISFGSGRSRQQLLKLQIELLGTLRSMNLRPVFALCGGSFVDPGVDAPGDLDQLLFYEGRLGEREMAGMFNRLARFKASGLDCQLHPADVAPVLVARIAAFYARVRTH